MKINSFRFSRSNTIGLESQTNNRVIIKIPLDTEGFWEKEYNQNELIGQIIQDFKSENFIDIPDDYFLDFYFQNKTLKMNDPIKSLLNYQIPTLYIDQMVKKKPIIFRDLPQFPYPDLVGRPYSQPFEVFLFSRQDKTLQIQVYDPNTINDLFLNEFCSSSAYCNGNNHLFISGGEKPNGEIIDNLWEINLLEQIIAEPTKIIPKKNHSMIFIPDRYVFIIGGNDKKCIYFNTETAEVEDWANLNKIRIEPALILIKNNLYCFDSINYRNNERFTVEKTDLDSLRPKWTLLFPKMDMILGNYIIINQEFFGVSKDDEDNIIFVGGNMNDQNRMFNYKYKTKENKVEMTNISFNKINLKEKTFLPLKKNIDFILPEFDRENPQVVFFMKNKNKIEVVNYQLKEPQSKGPTIDYKYDFNMPKVAIPDPISSFNFDQDNINDLINSNPNINNEAINGNNYIHNNNVNINNNINFNIDNNINDNLERNVINNNIIINNKMNDKRPFTFQEPEIEPAKEDLKLSLEFPNNNINNKKINKDHNIDENLENDINGISLKTNSNINDINFISNKNNVNMNNTNNLNNIDLDKDININITGTIIGNNQQKIKRNLNSNINIKESEIKGPNFNLNKNANIINENNSKINNISPNINIKNPNNNINNYNISQSIDISKFNINNPKIISSNIKTNIPEIKKEINIQRINPMPDYNLNGNIPGIKKTININNTNNKINIKNNTNTNNDKTKELFKMTGIIKGTGKKPNNAKVKNININNKIKNENITTGVKPGNQTNSIKNEKKLSIPKLNLEGRIPEFSESNDNINNNTKPHMINLRGDSNANNISYEVNHFSPTFQVNLNNNKNEITNELNGENNTFSLNNGNIQGSKMEMSSFDNNNFKEIQFEQRNLGVRKININNEDDNIKANIPNENINVRLEQTSFGNNNISGVPIKNSANENIVISGIIPGSSVRKHPFIDNDKDNNQINSPINNNINIKSSFNPNNKIQNGNANNINTNIYISSSNPAPNNSNNINSLKNANYENNTNNINKQNTKTKINLPLVGVKNDTFVSSKVEQVNSLDVDNIDINNLKSSNVGINGIKNGERTEE